MTKRKVLFVIGLMTIILVASLSFFFFVPVRQVTTTTTITTSITVTTEITRRTTITEYEPQWHLVTVFYGTGTTTKNTAGFYIPSDQWRITWGCRVHPDYPKLSLFSFFVYPQGETRQYIGTVYSAGESKEDQTYLYEGRGYYYLKIITANTGAWVIVVEAYY